MSKVILKSQEDTSRSALLIISLEIVWIMIILLHAHPQVAFYTCVNFHQYWFIRKGEVAIIDRRNNEMI